MKSKSLLIIGLTMIIILGISFFIIKPPATDIWKAWQNLKRSGEELKQSEERNKITADLKQNKDEITRIATIAEKYIPKESESGDLVLELTAIANNYNLKVEKTSLEKSQTTKEASDETTDTTNKTKTAQPQPSASASASSGSVQNIDFTMSLSGGFIDYLNFLKNVETSTRLIIVKSMTIQMSKEEGGPVTFQLVGTAFSKPKVTVADNLDNIKVSKDTINTFLNLKSYAQPINLPQESGFGRTNPFEGY